MAFKLSRSVKDDHSVLNGRAFHRAVSVGDSLYLWAGQQNGFPEEHDSKEKRKFLSSIQHFPLLTGQWISRATTGVPPLGAYSYCCTALDNQLYYFGGWCGHVNCYHNSITQLDIDRFHWKELERTDPARPVMRRGSGGMMSFEHEGVQHLLMIGGVGSEPTIQLPYAKYTLFYDEVWRTNEHSIYNLSSRKWSIPAITGQCVVPTANFVFQKTSNSQVVMFGGAEDDGTGVKSSNNVYILKISIDNVCWECIKKPKGMVQWPSVRRFHAGAIFAIASDCPMLVISGGQDKKYDMISDYWIFNITQKSWRKLLMFSKRASHSLSAFVMSCNHVWLITAGGRHDNNLFIDSDDNVMLTELVSNDKGEWMVYNTFNSCFLGTENYKSKYLQLLQLCRKKCLEEDATDSGSVEFLVKDLEDKEAELKQKEKEVEFFRKQLEQKEKEYKQCHDQLQEKKEELRQSQEAIHIIQQQALTDDHWVINKEEVILTEEELGRGSYANVKVGIFRGLRVAVKSLHAIIISDYSLALFSREMSIASRVRHPNLVQFIGATKVDNPLILTELMSTSLLKVLQNQQLAKQQILGIAQDVALGLNYLHLFQPQPIIHRDISSPNVLLEPSVTEAGYKAKVADYGTAKLQHVTSTGTVMPGNPAYSAPEAPIPDRHTPAMDVYSYSVLLMEMALRSPPEMTTVNRERQSHRISWLPMKSLIQSGINNNYRVRPTMGQVIELLKVM